MEHTGMQQVVDVEWKFGGNTFRYAVVHYIPDPALKQLIFVFF
jgi:hypothetical protein